MSQDRFGSSDRIPEEIRDIGMRLCEDVTVLHTKWSLYLELFGSPENTALMSDLARAFFHTVEESLRNDLILSICRLSDPSRTLGGDNISFATLVAQCSDIPRVEDLLVAFQAACGPVRRYRHRHLGHNDLGSIIRPHVNLLPDVGRPELDQILQLAEGLLRAVYGHFSAGGLDFLSASVGGAEDLIHWLKTVRERVAESERELLGDGPG